MAILRAVRPLLLVGLWLCACAPERKTDPVLARASAPVELTVRRHEVRVKPTCTERGFDVYKCWFQKMDRHGCVYLDVGNPFQDTAGDDPCANPRSARLILSAEPLDKLDFEVDAPGSRFAWRTPEGWTVGYLWEGTLLVPLEVRARSTNAAALKLARSLGGLGGSSPLGTLSPPPPATTPIDWKKLPTLDDALPTLYFAADAELQPALLARLRQKGGDEAVASALLAESNLTAMGWEEAFESLDQERQRRLVQLQLQKVYESLSDPALDWLDEHPELLPKDFEAKLAAQAEAALDAGDLDLVQQWLPRGLSHHHPEVGRIACELITQNQLLETWGNGGGLSMGGSFYQDASAWLAVAVTRTRCPAVTAEYGSQPCSSELRCSPPPPPGSGDEPEPSHPLVDADDGQPREGELCGAEDVRKALASVGAPDDSPDLDDNLEPSARVAALLAQGPLPKSFELANARRRYRLDRSAFDGGDDLDPSSPCTADEGSVGDLLCALRADQTRFTVAGCRVEVDDAHQVAHFEPVILPDAGE